MMKLNRAHFARAADMFAVALVVALPWSTSITGVLVGLWLIAFLPTLDVAALRRVVATPAGGLPVLLWVLALVGMLWAFDLPVAERLNGLKPYHKLLFIPLLIVHFQRSGCAAWVMIGFLASCGVLQALSWAMILEPRVFGLWSRSGSVGIPVKDYIAQNSEFMVCFFLLAAIALKAWQEQRRRVAIACSLAALTFVANIFTAASSRTILVVLPVVLLLFAFKMLRWKGALAVLAGTAIAGVFVVLSAPGVRDNLVNMLKEVRQFQPEGASTRAGERLEFWRKSIGFIADAPLAGHGTGSIRDQFQRAAKAQTGMAALVAANPHNQTFAVAIQLGLLGTVVLFAMWIGHAWLFRGDGLLPWIGLMIVVQNIVGSLFNAHLFDFTQGWGYAIGVGVAAGALFKGQASGGTFRSTA